MKITVKVYPRSKQEKIVKTDFGLELYFNIVPGKGKVNEKVIQMVADYYKVPKSNVKIISGQKSNIKRIEV